MDQKRQFSSFDRMASLLRGLSMVFLVGMVLPCMIPVILMGVFHPDAQLGPVRWSIIGALVLWPVAQYFGVYRARPMAAALAALCHLVVTGVIIAGLATLASSEDPVTVEWVVFLTAASVGEVGFGLLTGWWAWCSFRSPDRVHQWLAERKHVE